MVFFFNFDFSAKNSGISTYALIEPMAIHDTASFDSTIPRVKPYSADEKKFVVVDVGEIEGAVGLLTDIDCTAKEKESRRNVYSGSEKSFKYVIRPGQAFPKNLKNILGNISNLYVSRR
jgi:hypothetical protein